MAMLDFLIFGRLVVTIYQLDILHASLEIYISRHFLRLPTNLDLCNDLVNKVAKILANRLSKMIPKIISLNQTAFIKGRGIL